MPLLPERTSSLVLGATSLFGWAYLRRHPAAAGTAPRSCRTPLPARIRSADAERPADWARLIDELRPELVVHAAGVCNVARAERDPDWSWRVNVAATAALLDGLPTSCRLVYCSSDHVFGAGGPTPLSERSPVAPISVYGRCRVAAEELIRRRRPDALIVRAGLILGPSCDGRRGHIDWLRRRSARGLPMTVVADEWRHAVAADDLVDRLDAWLARGRSGLIHARSQLVDRPTLARRLLAGIDERAELHVATRAEQAAPHLGRIDLVSEVDDLPPLPEPPVFKRFGDPGDDAGISPSCRASPGL